MKPVQPGLTIVETVISLALIAIFIIIGVAAIEGVSVQSVKSEQQKIAIDEADKYVEMYKLKAHELPPGCSGTPIIQLQSPLDVDNLPDNASVEVELIWPNGCSRSAQIRATVTYGSKPYTVVRGSYVL